MLGVSEKPTASHASALPCMYTSRYSEFPSLVSIPMNIVHVSGAQSVGSRIMVSYSSGSLPYNQELKKGITLFIC